MAHPTYHAHQTPSETTQQQSGAQPPDQNKPNPNPLKDNLDVGGVGLPRLLVQRRGAEEEPLAAGVGRRCVLVRFLGVIYQETGIFVACVGL